MRYNRAGIATRKGKTFTQSSQAGYVIYRACNSGRLQAQQFVLSEGQRLDTVAANFYGESKYWWVIAAASGIGWQCQVPPGTLLKIPTSIEDVKRIVG